MEHSVRCGGVDRIGIKWSDSRGGGEGGGNGDGYGSRAMEGGRISHRFGSVEL